MALTVNWAHPLLSGALDVIWSGKNTLTPVGALPTTTATGVDPDALALGAGDLTSGYIQAGAPGFVGHSGDMTITVVAMAHAATKGLIAGYDFFSGSTYGSLLVSMNERRTGGYDQRGSIALDYMPLRSGYAAGVSIGSDYQADLTDMPFYTADELAAVSFAFEGASASDLRTVVDGVTRTSKFTRANVIPSAGGSTSFSGMGLGGRYVASSSAMQGANGAGSVALIIVHGRKLTEAEQQSLTADPWQVFNSASDTTPPTLTSPSATATGTTTASGLVSTNEANGTLYYLASANATELAATVKAGSSQAVTATGEQPVTITGLTAATPYYPHYLHRDAAGNDSAVASGAQFTTAAANTSPSFTGPNIADISGTEAVALTPVDVSAKFFDSESGLTFSAIGSWPAGVTVSSAGVISGTPTTAGTYASLQVRATDAGSLTADSNAFAITVAAAAVPSVTSDEFKNNTGTLLPSATIQKVWLIPFGTPDYTNLVTNGAGELVISEAGLSGDYLIVTANADGTEVGVSKATAS